MNIVVINKTLFYADIVSLMERGDTITHSEYLALPQGPVVASYEKRLVRDFERAGLGQQVADGLFLQRHGTGSFIFGSGAAAGVFGFMNRPTSGSSDTDSARAMARPARGRCERSSATE